jgi:hypothetical protein
VAATLEAARLTEAHRLAQQRVGRNAAAQALVAFRLLDHEDLDHTIERWIEVVVPLIQSNRQTSARLAASYLDVFRGMELGITPGRFTPDIAEDLPFRQLTTSLLVTGPAKIRSGLAKSHNVEQVLNAAQVATAGAAMRHAMNGGRDTVQRTVRADRSALGYARTVSGAPCAFCAMLASRGPVYKDDSFDASDARFHGFGEAKVHDHCSCGVEPVYRRDAAWPIGTNRYSQLWQDSTRGLSGDAARNAFRRALEAQR